MHWLWPFLSALIHPDKKAGSMPQRLSCQPTLRELQSTLPPSQRSLLFPPQTGFAQTSDKGYKENETEHSGVKPLSGSMKDSWKVNSNREENYTKNEKESPTVRLFFMPLIWQRGCHVWMFLRFLQQKCQHCIKYQHQSGLPTTLKPLSNTWPEPASL